MQNHQFSFTKVSSSIRIIIWSAQDLVWHPFVCINSSTSPFGYSINSSKEVGVFQLSNWSKTMRKVTESYKCIHEFISGIDNNNLNCQMPFKYPTANDDQQTILQPFINIAWFRHEEDNNSNSDDHSKIYSINKVENDNRSFVFPCSKCNVNEKAENKKEASCKQWCVHHITTHFIRRLIIFGATILVYKQMMVIKKKKGTFD